MGTGEITRFPQHNSLGGFTLIETMTTLAIASILLTAAVPSMRDFVIRSRMSSEVNTFVASLYLARSEAVKRIQNVRVCPATFDAEGNVTGCTGGTSWQGGWMVFADTDQNKSFTPNVDVVLQQNPKLPPKFKIVGDWGRPAAIYQPTGQSAGSNNTFRFTYAGSAAISRYVCLSNDGRVYVRQPPFAGCS